MAKKGQKFIRFSDEERTEIVNKYLSGKYGYHTLANDKMENLDKIIYIADLIEDGRKLPGLEPIRKMAYEDLEKTLVLALEYCIENVRERGKKIHYQSEKALIAAQERTKDKM